MCGPADSSCDLDFALGVFNRARYSVLDSNAEVRNYSYVFNVCANTGQVPSSATTPQSVCASKATEAPAWQVANFGQDCEPLGDSPEDVDWAMMGAIMWRGWREVSTPRVTWRVRMACDMCAQIRSM